MESFQFMDGWKSLIAPFLNALSMLVQRESEIFEAVNRFNCFVINEDGVLE